MRSVENDLMEWTIFYIKNKDIIKKELKDYKVMKNFIEFEYVNKNHIYYIYPELNEEAISKNNQGHTTLVCLNKVSNLKFLVDKWEKVNSNPRLSLIFVNPKANQKWIIFPYIHNKITEKESLKLGLRTLFEGVAEV